MKKASTQGASKTRFETISLDQIVASFRAAPHSVLARLPPIPPPCQEHLMLWLDRHAQSLHSTQAQHQTITELKGHLHTVNQSYGEWQLSQYEPVSDASNEPEHSQEQLLELFHHHLPRTCISRLQQLSQSPNPNPLDIDFHLTIFISLAGDHTLPPPLVHVFRDLLNDLQRLHSQLQYIATQAAILSAEITQMRETLTSMHRAAPFAVAAKKEVPSSHHKEKPSSTPAIASSKTAEEHQSGEPLDSSNSSDELNSLLNSLDLHFNGGSALLHAPSPLHLTPEEEQQKKQIEDIINAHALLPVEFTLSPQQFHELTEQAQSFYTINEFFFFIDSLIHPCEESADIIEHFTEHEAAWESALIQTKHLLGLTHDVLDFDHNPAAESKKTSPDATTTPSSLYDELSLHTDTSFPSGTNLAFFHHPHRGSSPSMAGQMERPLFEHSHFSMLTEDELLEQAILASLKPNAAPLSSREADPHHTSSSPAASNLDGEAKPHHDSSASAAAHTSGETKSSHRKSLPESSAAASERRGAFESTPGFSTPIWPSSMAGMFQQNPSCQRLPTQERKNLTLKLNNLISIYSANDLPQLADFKLSKTQFRTLKRLHEINQFSTSSVRNTLLPGLSKSSITPESESAWKTLGAAIAEQLTMHLTLSQPEWA